jgi:hypothetical protein
MHNLPGRHPPAHAKTMSCEIHNQSQSVPETIYLLESAFDICFLFLDKSSIGQAVLDVLKDRHC